MPITAKKCVPAVWSPRTAVITMPKAAPSIAPRYMDGENTPPAKRKPKDITVASVFMTMKTSSWWKA